LDADTLKSKRIIEEQAFACLLISACFLFFNLDCLDHLRSAPLLICNFCHEIFEHLSPFQVHIQTCCSPPPIELKPKMDQAAMDQLARSLWKAVFLRELKNMPIGQNFSKF
jgi:hypothetical protein